MLGVVDGVEEEEEEDGGDNWGLWTIATWQQSVHRFMPDLRERLIFNSEVQTILSLSCNRGRDGARTRRAHDIQLSGIRNRRDGCAKSG